MSEPTKQNTVAFLGTSAEYDLEEAAVPIDDMIDALTQAQEDGAEYVTGLTGNYRGAKYVRLTTEIDFVEAAL